MANKTNLVAANACLDQIRNWLEKGAVIKAANLKRPVLRQLPSGDYDTNLIVSFPDKK